MVVVLPKSRLPISNVAKMALGKELRRVTISKEFCPRGAEHKICRQQTSMGSYFALCPTEGYKRFKVQCKNCREEMVTVYAKDKTLTDWRRLKYTSWHDNRYWYGLRGLNINPETSALMIDCSCQPEFRKTPNEFNVKELK